MPSASEMNQRKREPRDEFYTLYETIESEVLSYPVEVWKGKVVYCPCDASWSNFYRFFIDHFKRLELKEVIFSSIEGRYCRYSGKDLEWLKMPADVFCPSGDFRSLFAKDLMKQADVIVTNPPFGLFLQFFEQIVRLKKEYLLICFTPIISKGILMREILKGNLFCGNSVKAGNLTFEVCGDYEKSKNVTDKNLVTFGCTWITNLPVFEKNLNVFDVDKDYIAALQRYDKFPDVINIERIDKIPTNYDGVMGVPITYMRKYNPKKYKILGRNGFGIESALEIKGKKLFDRLFIQKKTSQC